MRRWQCQGKHEVFRHSLDRTASIINSIIVIVIVVLLQPITVQPCWRNANAVISLSLAQEAITIITASDVNSKRLTMRLCKVKQHFVSNDFSN